MLHAQRHCSKPSCQALAGLVIMHILRLSAVELLRQYVVDKPPESAARYAFSGHTQACQQASLAGCRDMRLRALAAVPSADAMLVVLRPSTIWHFRFIDAAPCSEVARELHGGEYFRHITHAFATARSTH